MKRLNTRDAFALGDSLLRSDAGGRFSEKQLSVIKRESMTGVGPYVDNRGSRDSLSEEQLDELARRGLIDLKAAPIGKRVDGVLLYAVQIPDRTPGADRAADEDGAPRFREANSLPSRDVLLVIIFRDDGKTIARWNTDW